MIQKHKHKHTNIFILKHFSRPTKPTMFPFPSPNTRRISNPALHAIARATGTTAVAVAALSSGGTWANTGPTSHPMQLDRNFQPTEEEKARQEEARLAKQKAKKW
jgi:hypothetical protein